MSTGSRKILIVTCQALPDGAHPTAGGSLRAHNLGLALAGRGHRVVYAVPMETFVEAGGHERIPYEIGGLDALIDRVAPDLLLFANWGLAIHAGRSGIPTITDINGSLILENFYRGRRELLLDSLTKLRVVAASDLILAGSEEQKAYLTAWSLVAGISPDEVRIEVVPFSLAEEAPERRVPEGLQVVMAGYDWPWLNGSQAVTAVARELERTATGALHLFSAPPDYNDILNGEDSSIDTSGQLHEIRHPRVVQHRAVPFAELAETLARSSLALDVWRKNSERELAFSSRTVTYLWAGLPVIVGNYGELARLIGEYRAGWPVDPERPEEIAAIIASLIADPARLAEYSGNARRLFAERFSRQKTIEPVDRFCRMPVRSGRSSQLLDLLDSRERTITGQQSAIARLAREREVLGAVNRRPKGFSLIAHPSLLRSPRRRLLRTPLLLYLYLLGVTGETLHRIRTARNKSCAS